MLGSFFAETALPLLLTALTALAAWALSSLASFLGARKEAIEEESEHSSGHAFRRLAYRVAYSAVRAAEEKFRGDGRGEEKRNYALSIIQAELPGISESYADCCLHEAVRDTREEHSFPASE